MSGNTSTREQEDLVAVYNQRDLILYALSVGFGSKTTSNQSRQDELKYLYEKHSAFTAVPTFCLALTFWASQRQGVAGSSSYEIPPFPPATMAAIIPSKYLKSTDEDISQYPVIHMSQSIQWHCDLPVPTATTEQIRTRLDKKVLSVVPKSIGTFVTSETEIWEDKTNGVQLCTLQATSLVLGMSEENVIAKDDYSLRAKRTKVPVVKIPQGKEPSFEWTYDVAPTQALLYRLASGDSNKIHVVGDESMANILGLSDDTTPILHGLCTFAIAARAILQYLGNNVSFDRLEGRFTKPVFLNDKLSVKLWETTTTGSASSHSRTIVFVVVNKTKGETVVDQGLVQVHIKSTPAGMTSRL